MGGDPRDSVVSPEFRLHNLEKLYIIDASVFPTNTGVNPQHSIMTMAMTAIRSVLGDGG
jgi:choline dehydrogenase-like flavoprotein